MRKGFTSVMNPVFGLRIRIPSCAVSKRRRYLASEFLSASPERVRLVMAPSCGLVSLLSALENKGLGPWPTTFSLGDSGYCPLTTCGLSAAFLAGFPRVTRLAVAFNSIITPLLSFHQRLVHAPAP